MYLAVYQFGPRWEKGTRSMRSCERKQGSTCVQWKIEEKEQLLVSQPRFDKAQFEELQALVRAKDMSREEIEKLVDARSRAKLLDEIE